MSRTTGSSVPPAQHRLLALCLMLASLPALAAGPQEAHPETVDPSALTPAQGMLTLDYRKLALKGGGAIGLVSPEFSQFFSLDRYLYFGFDLGVTGLDGYHQIHGGVGHALSSPRKRKHRRALRR